jgi:hypothetical protein
MGLILPSGLTTESLWTTLPTVLGPLNPLNTELNPIYHLLVLLGARPIRHVSRIRVNKNLVGKRFEADVDVKRAVACWLQTLNTDFFYVGIQAVLPWGDRCLNVNNIYVEV